MTHRYPWSEHWTCPAFWSCLHFLKKLILNFKYQMIYLAYFTPVIQMVIVFERLNYCTFNILGIILKCLVCRVYEWKQSDPVLGELSCLVKVLSVLCQRKTVLFRWSIVEGVFFKDYFRFRYKMFYFDAKWS